MVRPALCGGKEGACYMDDFTINFAITFGVLLIGLAFIGGNDEK